MSLTKCTINTNVIEALPDAPTSSADELKRKFDQAPSEIKNFINDVMLKEIEQLVAKEKENLQTIITETKNNLLTNISEKILEDNKKKYYVGKIIIDTENINPATYLGFGTWEYWGQGRVPVGVDVSQDEFNEIEKTGGEKTHRLTIEEIPDHTHRLPMSVTSGDYLGAHDYVQYGGYQNGTTEKNGSWYSSVESVGKGQPHNIMQPYITCYMWKRVS